jgi:uncharacterized protein
VSAAGSGERPFLPRLAGFVRFLRLRGFSVGTGAALDLGRALREISILDRDTVCTACLISLAKSPDEASRLRDAFDLYWSTYIEPSDTQTRLAVSAPPSPPPDEIVPAADAAPAMRLGVDGRGVVRVGIYSPDAPSVGHLVRPLDRKRILAIRSGVRRLRRQIATRPGRHRGPARRGTIDFSATARHSLRQGGEWVEFRYKKRKERRADLLVLWDVSGSMREHEATLFALVHALHRLVRRTRVFAFGTALEEVTDILRGQSYGHAARTASGRLSPMGGGTRIGPCLEDFLRRYGRLVHDGTTLVVLSDGWDLGETARLSNALRRLHRLSHLVVWVNPYADDPRFEPATAGMREALPHVDFLLGPGHFEDRLGFSPDRVASRRRPARSAIRRKAFIASR